MYKLIACDLDETLLGDDRHVSLQDLEAIQSLKNYGVKFVPATGRGFKSIEATLKELNVFQKENEYVISYNGGALSENKNDRILHFEGIPFSIANALYQKGLTYDVCVHVYTQDHVYVAHINNDEKAYITGRIEYDVIDYDTIDFLKNEDIVKVLYSNTNYEYLKSIETDLQGLTNNLDVSYSSHRFIEFNHKGVNKGQGLLMLGKILDIKPEEMIAVGDNFNDLPMLKVAGLGIGVQNTVEDMKKECDYITKATHNESAISEIIEKFIINKE